MFKARYFRARYFGANFIGGGPPSGGSGDAELFIRRRGHVRIQGFIW